MQIEIQSQDWRLPLLFQRGVYCRVPLAASVYTTLFDIFSLTETYITSKVEVVFLDGHPLDNLHEAFISEGCRIALASGLPGVSGICMRRESPLQAYRSGISQDSNSNLQKQSCSEKVINENVTDGKVTDEKKEGMIELALFSLLMKDLYQHFLKRGVYLPAQVLAELLAEATPADYQKILVDKRATDLAPLQIKLTSLEPSQLICLKSIT